ncbi:hypothetical protein V2G26_002149 [Clonostachys chloroleuca]
MSENASYVPPTRSRRGCFTCRRRKKKCDERKPVCKGCTRNKLECKWPAERMRKPGQGSSEGIDADIVSVANSSAGHKALAPRSKGDFLPVTEASGSTINVDSSEYALQETDVTRGYLDALSPETILSPLIETETHHGSFSDGSKSSTSESVSFLPIEDAGAPQNALDEPGDERDITQVDNFDPYISTETCMIASPNLWDALMEPMPPSPTENIPASLSVLPHIDPDSSELLSFYLQKTANSMGNGSTDVNPFVVQLVPLAFQNNLVLRLILAQSAVHRQVSQDRQPSNELAERHYTDSLRLFRALVGVYLSGKHDGILPLAVGSLILSLTEVASGDIHGSTFNHIIAAKSLLKKVLPQRCAGMSLDLQNFLVEYYSHMSALSIIGMAPQIRLNSPMEPEIEAMANKMVEGKYVGQLCGCWLELLLVIPQIFALGECMKESSQGSTRPPSPDDITQFALLQARVLAFQSVPTVHPETALAGLVFKQAVLLYLWSILAGPHTVYEGNKMHHNLMKEAVVEALALLGQFPASARVNTSLCWPLAIIGCCISEEAQRDIVRNRLQTMLGTMSLGNMRETLVLLEHVWTRPLEDISPWNLSKMMEEKQIWISFA